MTNLITPNIPNGHGLAEIPSKNLSGNAEPSATKSKDFQKFEDHLSPAPTEALAQLGKSGQAALPNSIKPTLPIKDQRINTQGATASQTRSLATDKKIVAPQTTKAVSLAKDIKLPSSNPDTKLSPAKDLTSPTSTRTTDLKKPVDARDAKTPVSQTDSNHSPGSANTSDDKPNTDSRGKKPKLGGLNDDNDKNSNQTTPSDPQSPKAASAKDSLPTADDKDISVTVEIKIPDNGESWEKRLQDMLQFMGIQANAMPREMPSLAILTGQLQFVEPEAIPSTLAQSPMLGNVLASADPAELVEQVKPLGTWLQEMGWSPEGLKVKDPKAFNELMETPVSLKDLMKSFDVDVSRVVTEARILQDTLPIEGAAPYIARATRLQAEMGTKPSAAPKDPLLKVMPKDQDKLSDNPMAAEFLGVLLNANPLASSAPSMGESFSSKDNTALKSLGEASPRQLSSLEQILAGNNQSPLNPLINPQKAMLVGENPFQTMEIRTSETYVFQPDVAAPEVTSTPQRSDRHDWLENIQAFHLQSESSDVSSLGKDRPIDGAALFGSISDLPVNALPKDFDQGDSDGDDDFMDEPTDSDLAALGGNAPAKTGHKFQLAATEPSKTAPTEAAMKSVFDNASMLVKEGGGAMRIDIGNKELGAIDLAVEVKDNKVEIKIVAASPQAREMLATELPKLRDSLQNQNLNLQK